MRALRPSCRTAAEAAGFTLIELLVVLVIFGIALGLVAVRLLPDDLALARREAQDVALLLERAADESESTGRPLAWRPTAAGAEFEILDDAGHWQMLTGDSDFRTHALPGALHWSVLAFTNGDTATVAPPVRPASSTSGPGSAAGTATAGDDPLQQAPRLVFLPGQAAPEFSIELQAGGMRVQLKGNALGEVQVRTLDDGSRT